MLVRSELRLADYPKSCAMPDGVTLWTSVTDVGDGDDVGDRQFFIIRNDASVTVRKVTGNFSSFAMMPA
jgi:hypothetical protein